MRTHLVKLARALAVAPAFGLGAAAYSVFVEPRWVRLRRRSVSIPDLPIHLRGLRILHLSDMHYRPGLAITSSVLRRVARWSIDMSPDVVCLTGDFVENDADIEAMLAELGPLPARFGRFAVFGNHDHSRKLDPHENKTLHWKMFVADMLSRPWGYLARHDPPRNDIRHVEQALCRQGVQVLKNGNAQLDLPGGPLTIVGVDDAQQRRHDVRRAFRDVPPNSPVLLLAHSYDVLPDLALERPPILMLAGHTHGGQIRIPGLRPILTHTRIQLADARGIVYFRGFPIHVSPGLGASVPIRFGCRPEATLLTLRA